MVAFHGCTGIVVDSIGTVTPSVLLEVDHTAV